MAITLPARSKKGIGRVRAGALPTAADVPQAAIAGDPGVSVPDFGKFSTGAQAVASAGEEFAEGLRREDQEEAARLQAAEDRIRTRQDAVEHAKAVNVYSDNQEEALRKAKSEVDLSDPAQLKAYGESLSKGVSDSLENYSGSEESKLRLEERLIGIQGVLSGRAGVISAKVGRKKVKTHMGDSLNKVVTGIRGGTSITVGFDQIEQMIDDMAPALTEGEQDDWRRVGRSQVVETKAQMFIEAGDPDAVEEMLKMPGMAALLNNSAQDRIASSISASRAEIRKGTKGGMASAVTKIFQNGTTIQALPNGKVQVTGPGGNILEGQARLDALTAARKEELTFTRAKAGEQAAGTAAISQATKSFEQIGKIKKSILNIDKAIALVDKGAGTGPILSKLPSIRSASIELDNVQKAMGLDVIGTTTFGALSKGELDLALSKALPTGLEGPVLKEWLVAKKVAQEKLAAYLEDVAIFLGTPGNTIADWLETQRELGGQTIEPTAINRATGETMIFRNGQWQNQ